MKISTKVAQGRPSVDTDLTIDFAGATAANMQEWATPTIVIAWQRVMRDAGKIPAGAVTIKATDFMDGKGRPERQVTPEKILASVEKMTPEAAADLLKRLNAAAKVAPRK